MSTSLGIVSKSGTTKTIQGKNVMGDMYADALWHSNDSNEVTSIPHSLDCSMSEWILWESKHSVELSIESDPSLNDGQGVTISFPGIVKCAVSSVKGDVYIIRAKYLNAGDSKLDMFNNINRVSASTNDHLYLGDAILAKAAVDTSFQLTLEGDSEYLPKVLYFAYAACQDLGSES